MWRKCGVSGGWGAPRRPRNHAEPGSGAGAPAGAGPEHGPEARRVSAGGWWSSQAAAADLSNFGPRVFAAAGTQAVQWDVSRPLPPLSGAEPEADETLHGQFGLHVQPRVSLLSGAVGQCHSAGSYRAVTADPRPCHGGRDSPGSAPHAVAPFPLRSSIGHPAGALVSPAPGTEMREETR